MNVSGKYFILAYFNKFFTKTVLHDLGKDVNGEQGVGIYRREFSVPAHSRTEKMLR